MKNWLIIFTLLLLTVPIPSLGAEDWDISLFKSDIQLQENGDLKVIETIEVNFKGTPKHGIFRDIPYIYGSEPTKTYLNIRMASATLDNAAIIWKNNNLFQEGIVRIQIGDPEKTFSSKHTYRIEYLVTGALKAFDKHDELHWDVTGAEWAVPIETMKVNVTLPRPGIIKSECLVSRADKKIPCEKKSSNEQSISLEASNLEPKEDVFIKVAYAVGMTPVLTVLPKEELIKSTERSSFITFLIVVVFGAVLFFQIWRQLNLSKWFGDKLEG